MSRNTILKQRYTHPNLLAQDKNILSVGNLHFSNEENQNQLNSSCPEGPYTSCLKMKLSILEANAALENEEENGGEQQRGAATEAKGSSHLLIDEDEEDFEIGHDYNAKISKWNNTVDENGDDYDGNNIGDDDTVLSRIIARDSNLLLLDEDANNEDDDFDGDGDDERTNNGYVESSVDEKSESSVFSGDCLEYSGNCHSDEDSEAGSINLDHVTSDGDSEVEDESISFMTRGSTNIGPSCFLEDAKHVNNIESVFMNESQSSHRYSLCGEFQQYLDPSPQFRARIQYRVRIVLIHPLFVLGGRSDSAFLNIYNKIFGKNLLSIGFRSVTELCQAMPYVVNRKVMDEQGELCLVESSNNLRAVASIRSGLRRIVYNILQSHPQGIISRNFEEEFYNETGKTLTDVLKDHAYSIPRAECMVRDMLDIAYLRYTKSSQTIVLCKDAEDPALTDGLLIGRTTNNCISFNENAGIEDSNTWEGRRITGKNAECSYSKTSTKKIEGNRLPPEISSIGMPPDSFSKGLLPDKPDDEAVNFCIVTYQGRNTEGLESSQTSEDGEESISCGEDYILQVRLRLRLLLRCWNSGNGIEVSNLHGVYERTFAMKLNLNGLGFTSIEELVNCWSEITLVVDQKPGIVFLQPSVQNKRIVKTMCTGLRETVFSVLLSSFPDGMDVYNFLQSLNQSYSGNLGRILKNNGYLTDEISDVVTFLRNEQHNYQLYCSKALRLLFQDMSDFVRLGCQEDGSLVVKLRGKDFPILDLDCGMDGFLLEKIWPDNLCSEEAATFMAGQQPQICTRNERVNISKPNFYSTNFETDSHSCSSSKLTLQVLKHQFRLILGSPLYLKYGIPCQQLSSIYEERVGHAPILVEHKDIKSLLSLMPEVASINSISGQVFLKRTNKNNRILSAVKAGIRQILYWSLLKNPGGIWDQLIEGWYSDFDGKSFVTTLSKHGYKISRKSYLATISTFLDDMRDFLCRHPTEDGLYILVEDSVDPTSADARLLGMSQSDIQYDPLREHLQYFHTNVDSFGECGVDIPDHLANEFAIKVNDSSSCHVGIIEHVMEHSASKESMIPRGRQILDISTADKEYANDYDEEETQVDCTSSNAKISNNIFDLVSDDDKECHREIIGSESKRSNFSSELDQSASSDEEFRKFCRPSTGRRNNFEPLGLKVRAYP